MPEVNLISAYSSAVSQHRKYVIYDEFAYTANEYKGCYLPTLDYPDPPEKQLNRYGVTCEIDDTR